ncbi:hypothetical protein PMI15_04537 [Polaromonas sp. CF318]|nr:hypothetical protein PMI15_04537 [Polaromonas sp. CF318]
MPCFRLGGKPTGKPSVFKHFRRFPAAAKIAPDLSGFAPHGVNGRAQFVLGALQFSAPGLHDPRIKQGDAVNRRGGFGRLRSHHGSPFRWDSSCCRSAPGLFPGPDTSCYMTLLPFGLYRIPQLEEAAGNASLRIQGFSLVRLSGRQLAPPWTAGTKAYRSAPRRRAPVPSRPFHRWCRLRGYRWRDGCCLRGWN